MITESDSTDSEESDDDDEDTKYVPAWTQILNDFYGGEKLLDAVQIAEIVLYNSKLFDGECLLPEEDDRHLPYSIKLDILRKASESEVRNYLSDKIPSGNGTLSAIVVGDNFWLEGLFRGLGGLKKIKGVLPDHHNQNKIEPTPEHRTLIIEDIMKLLFPASE